MRSYLHPALFNPRTRYSFVSGLLALAATVALLVGLAPVVGVRAVAIDRTSDVQQSWSSQCQNWSVDVAGTGMNQLDSQSITIPADAVWSTVQLAGGRAGGSSLDKPTRADFSFDGGTPVEMSTRTRTLEDPPIEPSDGLGFTYELTALAGEQVDATIYGDNDHVAQGLLAYTAREATDGTLYSSAGTTTLQYTWGRSGTTNGMPNAVEWLAFPEALTDAATMNVQVVVADLEDGDPRHLHVLVTPYDADGTALAATTTIEDINHPEGVPDNGLLIEVMDVAVPAQTQQLKIELQSPPHPDGSNQFVSPYGGESAFLVGVVAQYACPEPEPLPVVFEKTWQVGNDAATLLPPSDVGTFSITAESFDADNVAYDSVTCTYDATSTLDCAYSDGQALQVPVDGSYTVSEANMPAHWATTAGTGSGFVADGSGFCELTSEDVCLHTLTNAKDTQGVVMEKTWQVGDDPATTTPPDDVGSFSITARSYEHAGDSAPFDSVTCAYTGSTLVCDYSDAQALQVPDGGTYTVSEASMPADWSVVAGAGSGFVADGSGFCTLSGDTCLHTVENYSEPPEPFAVTFRKLWQVGDDPATATPPDGVGSFRITAESFDADNVAFDSVTCTYAGTTLSCAYSDGQALQVPADGTYTVSEANMPADWSVVAGTGSGFVADGSGFCAVQTDGTCRHTVKNLTVPPDTVPVTIDKTWQLGDDPATTTPPADLPKGFSITAQSFDADNVAFDSATCTYAGTTLNCAYSDGQALQVPASGTYSVSETSMPVHWATTAGVGSGFTVDSGNYCTLDNTGTCLHTVTNAKDTQGVVIEKTWQEGNEPASALPPSDVGSFSITAQSFEHAGDTVAYESVTCTYDATSTLVCDYADGQALQVPDGGTYTVSEASMPAGWSVVAGTGSGFVADGSGFCALSGDTCLHTVENYLEPAEPQAVVFAKTWQEGDGPTTATPPDGVGSFSITARSFAELGDAPVFDSVTCTYAGTTLNCAYSNGAALQVPEGGYYSVSETGMPADWQTIAGTGMVFSLDSEPYCRPTADGCLHTVRNWREAVSTQGIILEKTWQSGDALPAPQPPADLPAAFSITARSFESPESTTPFDTATCSYEGGSTLSCIYSDGRALQVPEGGSYSVSEANMPADWQTIAGTGSQFSPFEGAYCERIDETTCRHTVKNWMQIDFNETYINFEKVWLSPEGNEVPPAEVDFVYIFQIEATSYVDGVEVGSAQCSYEYVNGVPELACTYSMSEEGILGRTSADVPGLLVPADGTFNVTEHIPGGWRAVSGVGEGLTCTPQGPLPTDGSPIICTHTLVNQEMTFTPTSVEIRLAPEGTTVTWEPVANEATIEGYHVWRSTDSNVHNAVRVTDTIIEPANALARSTSETAYVWTDTDPMAGSGRTYWIQVVNTDGTSTWLGESERHIQRVFLPLGSY